jgi:hypothetical protein
MFPIPLGARAESKTPPGLESYFFFDFLAFFAFFAFFAFLAIVSSQGLMDGNATREACSAEGQPRNILEPNPTDSQAAAPRCHVAVIALSTDVMRFFAIFGLATRFRRKNP